MSQFRLEQVFDELDRQTKLAGAVIEVEIDALRPSPFQPRSRPEEGLEELVASVKRVGVVQPIPVRRAQEGYEILAGERRWRAARLAGLEKVPVVVREVDDRTAREIALAENLLRENLNPLEETRAVVALLQSLLDLESPEAVIELLRRMRVRERRGEAFVGEESEAAEVLGRLGLKASSFVVNRLPLLRLPEDVQEAMAKGVVGVALGLRLGRVMDEEKRARALALAEEGASQREVLEAITEPAASPPPSRAVAELRRLLGSLGPEERAQLEPHVRAIEAFLKKRRSV